MASSIIRVCVFADIQINREAEEAVHFQNGGMQLRIFSASKQRFGKLWVDVTHALSITSTVIGGNNSADYTLTKAPLCI